MHKSLRRVIYWLRRGRMDEELVEEMEFHRTMREDALRRSGLSAEDARTESRRAFGNGLAAREDARGVWIWPWLERLLQEAKLAVRTLAKNRGFTVVTILTFAIGIGAVVSVFSIADPLLMRPLPVRDPGELVILRTVDRISLAETFLVRQPLYDRISNNSSTLSAVLGVHDFEPVLEIALESPDVDTDEKGRGRASVQPVTGNYFSVLGVEADLGRVFTASDDAAEAPLTVVLSYRFWQRQFGGNRDVVGKTIRLENPSMDLLSPGSIAVISGVAPPEFYGTDVDQAPDLWLPLNRAVEERLIFSSPLVDSLRVMGRARPGVTLDRIQEEIDAVIGQLELPSLTPALERMQFQAGVGDRTAELDRLRQINIRVEPGATGYSELRPQFSRPLMVLGGAVGVVLSMVLTNIAALMLARGSSRRREIAIRIAVGSGRLGIARQFLLEGLILAGAGAVLGLIAAHWGTVVIASYLPPESAFVSRLSLDMRTLIFTGIVCLLSTITVAILPAIRTSRIEPYRTLKAADGYLTRSGVRLPLNKVIVTAQIAFSLLLLIGAGLFLRTFQNLKGAEIGFDDRNVIEFSIDAPVMAFSGLARSDFERFEALPAVESMTFYGVYGLLGAEADVSEIRATGSLALGTDPVRVPLILIGPRFFDTMGIPVFSGREFAGGPTLANAGDQDSIIVSQSLARALFGDEDAVGRRVRWNSSGARSDREVEIVGVVGDVKHVSVRDQTAMAFYISAPVSAPFLTRFALRTSEEAAALAPAIRSIVEGMDSDFRVVSIHTLNEVRMASIVRERFVAQLSGVFGIIALLLASVGVYGVLSYAVTQRTGEIGIRMALGAQTRNVIGMVMREMMGVAFIGLLLGLAAAVATTHLASSLLYEVTSTDPATILGAALILVVAAAIAAYIPARRASRVDPMTALRTE